MAIVRLFLTLVALTAWCLSLAPAADLKKVERTIIKEPAYRSKSPQYCLLVFGLDTKTRVWLALDGETLYVDRNGNGDLTEAGEQAKVRTTPDKDPAHFEEVELPGGDGRTKNKLQLAVWGWSDFQRGEKDHCEPSVHLTWGGRSYGAWGDEQSSLVFASRPQDAPILHIDGPLQMGFETLWEWAWEKKGKDTYELYVGIGTKGLGKGAFVHLKYDLVPKDVYPTAELEFPSRNPKDPPVRVPIVLKKRC